MTDSLQRKLQAEFAEAVDRAELYLADRERLGDLIDEATVKAGSLLEDQMTDLQTPLRVMLRLATAYSRGEYTRVAAPALRQIVAALLYLVNPLDLLPDSIPSIGLLDDIFVLKLTIRNSAEALDQFERWEKTSR